MVIDKIKAMKSQYPSFSPDEVHCSSIENGIFFAEWNNYSFYLTSISNAEINIVSESGEREKYICDFGNETINRGIITQLCFDRSNNGLVFIEALSKSVIRYSLTDNTVLNCIKLEQDEIKDASVLNGLAVAVDGTIFYVSRVQDGSAFVNIINNQDYKAALLQRINLSSGLDNVSASYNDVRDELYICSKGSTGFYVISRCGKTKYVDLQSYGLCFYSIVFYNGFVYLITASDLSGAFLVKVNLKGELIWQYSLNSTSVLTDITATDQGLAIVSRSNNALILLERV